MTASEEVAKPTPYTPGPNAVDITPEKDGGVLKEIIKEGEGTEFPGTGCTVTAHYHGTLLDGTVFDSSKESGKPFEFVLGKGSVIKAWDLGVATMRKGEVAMLTCKPEYAYGKRGSPPKIPADATLVFEITLISWQAEDISKAKDGGILRTNITKGEGYLTPNEGSLVKIHLTGKYGDKIFEDRDVDFELGEGSEHGIIEGVEKALEKFKKGEKSTLEIKPKYAFRDKGHEEFGIPPFATVHYTVELKEFEKARESWDMDSAEKINQAKLLKEKATNYFKAGKYPLALRFYNKINDYIDSDAGFDEKENEERKSLLLANRLNLGLVYLKTKQPYEAKNECDKALELDAKNVKGFFRRGQAYLDMGEPERAKNDFEEVVKIEPSNKLAANQILVCLKQIKEQRQKEKKIYANMFEKFAAKDKEDKVIRYGWWDDNQEKPVITETEPVDNEDVEEMKKEKKKQLEHLKKLAEQKRKEREEAERLAKEEEERKAKEEAEKKIAGLEESEKTENSTEKEPQDAQNASPEAKEDSGTQKEELTKEKEPDTMKVLGEWGKDERDREPTEFEQENPDILMLNKDDEFKNM